MTAWLRVSKQKPCAICGKGDWCTVAADGSAACCMRVESGKRLHNGGWLHKTGTPAPRIEYRAPVKSAVKVDFYRTWRDWNTQTNEADIAKYGALIGVSEQSLGNLGASWAWPHGAWAFPMRSGAGDVVGIRLRADNGRKWAVTGSRQGLFLPVVWPESTQVALICEGPTDTAAALSIGFQAIGRPSCLGCEGMVAETCKRVTIRRVVIVADNDGPGRDGARKLADSLKIPWKIIVPAAKDLRAWVQAGATKELVECVMNQKLWRMP